MSALTEPILAIRDVTKSFDGLRAVAGASFDVERGSITALIGPNGAGKTTMFDLLSGFARPDSGRSALPAGKSPTWRPIASPSLAWSVPSS